MRKFIILFISVLLIGGGFLFIRKLASDFDPSLKIENGDVSFEYEEISSLSTPANETVVISQLSDLQKIVKEHNFNIKHTYIYTRFEADTNHHYEISNITKSGSRIYINIDVKDNKKAGSSEAQTYTKEYIIDITGNLSKETAVQVDLKKDEIIEKNSEAASEETSEK